MEATNPASNVDERFCRKAFALVIELLTYVPPAGFEPATPALGERCSIP